MCMYVWWFLGRRVVCFDGCVWNFRYYSLEFVICVVLFGGGKEGEFVGREGREGRSERYKFLAFFFMLSWKNGGGEGGEGVFVLYLFEVDRFGGMGRYV